jgi:hypothetical protein
MLDKADTENFIHSDLSKIFQVADTPEEAIKHVFNQVQQEVNFHIPVTL